jgi:hypothetical protein
VSEWSGFHFSLGATRGYNCKDVPSTASRKAARGSLRDRRARYHGRRCYFRSAIEVFTIVREPVDRVISIFFQSDRDRPDLDSGLGLDHDNHQVRMLSNCPELDAPWDPKGRPISTPPVERRHLEMAKRNIEERFIAAAPMKSSPLSFGS